MSIARIDAHPLSYPDPNDSGRSRFVTLARVETESGAVGWGEAVTQPGDAALACKVVIERGLAPLLQGRDETRVRSLWQTMRDYAYWSGHGGIVTFAASAIDIALWDVAGKLANLPIHALIGGKLHDRLPACASVIWDTEDLEQTQRQFAGFVSAGFRTVKGGWGLNHQAAFGLDAVRDVEVVRHVREAIGGEVEFVADVCAWANWTSSHAIRMAHHFEELGLTWLEDPLPSDAYEDLARLRSAVTLPIATGEREWTIDGYRRLVRSRGVDIILIDPGRAEGLTGMKLASEDAAASGVRVVPHSWSSAINTAASLHVLASCPNVQVFELKEHPTPVTHDLVDYPFTQRDGQIEVPDRPGLGIEVDEVVVKKLRYED